MPADRSTPAQEQLLANHLEQARRRLNSRYPDLGAAVVDGVVAQAKAELSGARITDYVGVLVESLSRQRLRSLARPD